MREQNRRLGIRSSTIATHDKEARTEAPGRVQPREYTNAEESGSKFENPPPVLELDSLRPTEAVKCPANVPVEEDARDIAIENLVAKANDQGNQQTPRLLLRRFSARAARMQGPNRECGCGRSREDELLAEDEVLSQRNDEEDTKVATCKGQREELAKVARWGAQQAQSIHGGDRGYLCANLVSRVTWKRSTQAHEKNPKPTGRRG